jgi:hypothetical protein
MEHISGVKASVTVVAATFMSTFVGWLQILQPWLTALGTAAGGLLSLVLAYNHWKSGRLERHRLELQNEQLRRSLGTPPAAV